MLPVSFKRFTTVNTVLVDGWFHLEILKHTALQPHVYFDDILRKATPFQYTDYYLASFFVLLHCISQDYNK